MSMEAYGGVEEEVDEGAVVEEAEEAEEEVEVEVEEEEEGEGGAPKGAKGVPPKFL